MTHFPILNSKNFLHKSILFFFVFGSLFPTIRVLLLGSKTSTNIFEYIISGLPEILLFAILAYALILHFQTNISFKMRGFDWLVLAFAISNVVIGIILAHNLKISSYGFRMTYLPVSFYFLARLQVLEIDSLEKLIVSIFYWFFIIGVIGIILYFGFYDTMIRMIYLSGGKVNEYFVTRMTSVFWSPVFFGTIMTFTMLFFFFQLTCKNSFLNYFLISITWICVIFSVTRGALIILIVGIIFLTFVSKKWSLFSKDFLILMVIFVICSFYISSPSEFIGWLMQSSVDTIGMTKGITRVELWKKAFQNFKEMPFGYGLGKAGHVATRFFYQTTTEASMYSTDGWFLKLVNETGIWGILSYFILSGTYFMQSLAWMKKHSYSFFYFVFAVFCLVNLQNLVSNVLDFYLFNYLFWLLVGIGQNIKISV